MHALLPLAFLLALFPKLDKRYVFYLLPIVWIVDLDFFIGATHRFLFGNIFFILILAGIIYWLWDRKAFFVAFFYGFSHLILDSGYPGTAWLWPLVNKTFYLTSTVDWSSGWIINLGIDSVSFEDYNALRDSLSADSYFTETSGLFLILFTLIVLVRYRKEIVKQIKAFF